MPSDGAQLAASAHPGSYANAGRKIRHFRPVLMTPLVGGQTSPPTVDRACVRSVLEVVLHAELQDARCAGLRDVQGRSDNSHVCSLFAVALSLNTSQRPVYTTALASRQSSTQARRSPLRIPSPFSGSTSRFPFSWQVTWMDGQSTINVASVQPKAAIDAACFAQLHRRGEPGDCVMGVMT